MCQRLPRQNRNQLAVRTERESDEKPPGVRFSVKTRQNHAGAYQLSPRLFTDAEFPPTSVAFNTRLPDGDIRQSLPIRWRTRSLPRPDNQLATRNPPVRAAYRIACQSRRLARQGVSLSTRSTCAANH